MTEFEGRERAYARPRRRVTGQDFQAKLLPTKWWPALVWSLLLSVVSVGNPYLGQLATNLQTQTLYAGMAMQAGQVPYSDFFATNGVLYYLMSYVGTLLPVNVLFAVFQFIGLMIAGIYFYKISSYLSQSEKTAISYSHWFYLFVLAIDFGGLYAGLFALPFILTSIWFLLRYFEGAVRDEAFILYGIDAALVFLIYPKSLSLWLVAGFVLLGYNLVERRKARGFYQLLATLFGFLLVVYAVGYYAFETQILGLAIQQTFLYNLNIDLTHGSIVQILGLVAAFLVCSGFLKSFFQTLLSFGQKRHGFSKALILLVFLLQIVLIVGNTDFQWNQLLLLVPYGFVLSLLHLEEPEDREEESTYLRTQFFLPLVFFLAIPLQLAYSYVVNGDLYQERVEVANYIQKETKETDTIYAWDNNARIYLDSQRLSSAGIITAEPYLQREDNQKALAYDLRKNEAQFIAVNRSIPLLEEVKTNLAQEYEVVEVGLEQFSLYQKK